MRRKGWVLTGTAPERKSSPVTEPKGAARLMGLPTFAWMDGCSDVSPLKICWAIGAEGPCMGRLE